MSTITLDINCRAAIKQALRLKFGGTGKYCALRGFNYSLATTLLRTGYCTHSTQPIKDAITEDLGLDAAVWDK